MKTRILSVVGYADSGKTSYLEKLVSLLTREGLQVAVIKHTSHSDAFMGGQGKDTDRHFSAGARSVALVGPSGFSLSVRGGEPALESILPMLGPVDLVFTEGYKRGPWPKIEVRRMESGQPALLAGPERLALVTDGDETGPDVFPLDRPEILARWLMEGVDDVGTER